MITQAWRLDMRLKDRTMLRQYMDYMDFRTVRELATAAGVSHSTVGHLHSGKRSTCSPKTAKAIERALKAPQGLLFDARSSKVSREVAA